MPSTGSISVSGLLGGTAGSIDVTSLVSSLMQAQSVPKNLLTDQLKTVSDKLSTYQTINSKLTAVQTAARALGAGTAGVTAWQTTAASSSSATVAATSTAAARPGSTTFDVVRLATGQLTTVAPAADGTVLTDPDNRFTLTGPDGNPQELVAQSGSASDVALAINNADLGVRASVINTDQGPQLQLASAKTGLDNGFSIDGLNGSARTLVAAGDAKLAIGGASGYTVSSPTNTFTDVIPGVSFSVSAPATGVTIDVKTDVAAITKSVQALVTAVNTARSELAGDSAQGQLLQGAPEVRQLLTALGSSVSQGTSAGESLQSYGIDIDDKGVISFNADKFTAAYTKDPAATRAAVGGSFATGLDAVATGAVDKPDGSITLAMGGLTESGTRLNGEIQDWTTKLTDIQSAMQAKYAAMQSALARLQGQQTYLTSMLNSITNSKESS